MSGLSEGAEGAIDNSVEKTEIYSPSLLETNFPYRELSRIATADRRAKDAVYSAHRWWARRPPSLMRGMLLAASLPTGTSSELFWDQFSRSAPFLRGLRVHDPFAGGGSTLVEAVRLGATPSGTDIDPLAVAITAHELAPSLPEVVSEVGSKLLSYLEHEFTQLYVPCASQWTPLHYFFWHEVTCPACRRSSPLYRSLLIAKHTGKRGAVVRDAAQTVVCPDCFSLRHLDKASQRSFRCCGRMHLIDRGNFFAQRFTCFHCGARSTHNDLQTGRAPRRLIAIEETSAKNYRRIREPSGKDRSLITKAKNYLRKNFARLHLPTGSFTQERTDGRPLSYGIVEPPELFSERQLCVFGAAFAWVHGQDLEHGVRRSLTLALSNALTTNNKLCGYATEYGRIAPLFSVRSYSLPALAVELNPLHLVAGRGTIARSIDRVARSADEHVRRYTWVPKDRRVRPIEVIYERSEHKGDIACGDARNVRLGSAGTVDLCVFDPPYFDYIAYSELSEFYRFWSGELGLGGAPLLPDASDRPISFGKSLGECLLSALYMLKPNRPLAFTFHSSDPDAWQAIGIALEAANLLVTALWPVRADHHMGHHAEEGNCEWDIVVVCRRAHECIRAVDGTTASKWVRSVRPLKVSAADRLNFKLALGMARTRRGQATGLS